MLELAKHIIDTKRGSFDAKAFEDRYEEAVAELVKAKIEGRPRRRGRPSSSGESARSAAGVTRERRESHRLA